MLKNFISYIKDKNLFQPEESVLLAVSGGLDSVAMARLFNEAKFNFAIAHCNFNLRGDESDADEQFVRKLAKKYKVEVFVNQFDTQQFAETEKVSIQMAARTLRYNWFSELLEEHGFAYLATAHHKNDNAETVLLNLVRGTGISGLHGILPKRGRIIRPLLFADKEMIMDYIAEKQLAWREDSSNSSNKYSRNLLRNEVIPLLKNINPDIEHTLETTIEKISAVENIFLRFIEEQKKELITFSDGDLIIDGNKLLDHPESKLIIYQILEPYNFNFSQAGSVLSSLNNAGGKIFDSTTHRLNVDRGKLILSKKNLSIFKSADIAESATSFVKDDFHLSFSFLNADETKITGDRNIALLDFDKLSFPLTIRKWKAGDWFCPLGMNKKKKLSDFMIDEKIPLNLKERAYVLVSGESIVWFVGRRIDDRFKITEKTEKVYKVVYSTENDKPV